MGVSFHAHIHITYIHPDKLYCISRYFWIFIHHLTGLLNRPDLLCFRIKFVDKPHLVVVPLSTMQNWEREFALWAPQLRVVSLGGNQESRDMLLKYEIFRKKSGSQLRGVSRQEMQERVRFHVCLTSYEMCVTHSSFLSKVDYECLIVDEGHRLKTKTSKLVKVGQQMWV